MADFFNPTAVSIWIISSVLAALAGPFGTFAADGFAYRLVYWSCVVFGGAVAGHISRQIATSLTGKSGPLVSDLVMVLVMSALFTPLLWGMTTRFFWSGYDDLPGFGTFLIYVAVITLCICLMRRIIPGFEPAGYFEKDISDGPVPRLHRRMPEGFKGPILRLTVQDHFVNVITATQTHSIRLRLCDAIDEMDTVDGFSTHRSHWVSRHAVSEVMRKDGRMSLKLVNGDVVPVSRTYKSALAQVGVA